MWYIMVKRHESLAPLSREHHSHLVFAKRLRDGKPNNPKSNWPSNNDEQTLINHVKQYFMVDMLNHFKLEEEIVFKTYRGYLEDNDPKLDLLNYIINHHKIVKAKISELTDLTNKDLLDKLKEIGFEIKNHIEKEEKKLFNDIQSTLPIDELISIKRELEEKSSLKCSHLL